MSDEKRRVLELLAQGTITEKDAARLLEALGQEPDGIPADREEEPEAPENPEGLGEQIDQAVQKDLAGLGEQIDQAVQKDLAGLGEQIDQVVQKGLAGLSGLGEQISRAVQSVPALVLSPEEAIPEEKADPADYPLPQGGSYDGDELESLHIHWVAGPVEIVQGDGAELKVTEYAKFPLQEEDRMHVIFKDGVMDIAWTEKQRHGRFHFGFRVPPLVKRLVVELPRGLTQLDNIKIGSASGAVSLLGPAAFQVDETAIETASGKIFVERLQGDEIRLHTASGAVDAGLLKGDEIHVETASGAIHLGSVSGDEISVYTASGSVNVTEAVGDEISLSTISGKLAVERFTGDEAELQTVSGSLHAAGTAETISAQTVSGTLQLAASGHPENLELKTVSGRAELVLPREIPGFTVNYESRTGGFKSDFPLEGDLGKKSGCARYGNGGAKITFETMSGSMQIKR